MMKFPTFSWFLQLRHLMSQHSSASLAAFPLIIDR
ncbi:hypothetical protein AWRI1631_43220, partial [Saccharomyces cerevisiae AWRI1631]